MAVHFSKPSKLFGLLEQDKRMGVGAVAKRSLVSFISCLSLGKIAVVNEPTAPEMLGKKFALFCVRVDTELVRLEN